MRVLVAIALVLSSGLASAEGLRRFAIIAGNDEGGADTRPLRFATADARRIHDIVTRFGDVAPADAELVLDANAAALRQALARVETRIASAAAKGEKSLLVVYFSGHAKDGALRLGDTALPFDEVRRTMSESAAAIRVGIIDACRSGALTRTKGARRAPVFHVDTAAARAARGLVLLTASATDEDAQESDALGGSYFSHHLASGLLGTADRSGDGRVTLAEAYAYAYERTVADTADTAAGAQHPTFSYDLAGHGDVVLTRLGSGHETLVLPANAPDGSWFVVDARGTVAAEVVKSTRRDHRLLLAPGTYRILRRLPDRLRIGEITLANGRSIRIDDALLEDAPFTDDPVKGLHRGSGSRWSFALGGGHQSFFAGSIFPSTGLVGLEAELRDYLRRDWHLGFDLALGGSDAALALDGTLLPYRYGQVTFGATLGREWGRGRFRPSLGLRFGAILVSRDFADATLPAQAYFATTPGLVGSLRIRLAGPVWATARLRTHYLYFNVGQAASLGYLEAAALLTYDRGAAP